MAIARDATSSGSGSSTTTLTYSHTCTGSQLGLWVSTRNDGGETVTGVTYNGVSLTQLPTYSPTLFAGTNQNITVWFLLAPATGANDIVVTTSGNQSALSSRGISYTGVAQSSVIDASNSTNYGGGGNAPTVTTSITVVASNCWALAYASNNSGGGCTAQGGSALVDYFGGNGDKWFDSNGTIGTGSRSSIVGGSSANWGQIMFSIAPYVAPPTQIKTIDGVTEANTKTFIGVAKASVKTWDGVANT